MVKAEKQKGDFQAINPGGGGMVDINAGGGQRLGGISLGWGVEIRF